MPLGPRLAGSSPMGVGKLPSWCLEGCLSGLDVEAVVGRLMMIWAWPCGYPSPPMTPKDIQELAVFAGRSRG